MPFSNVTNAVHSAIKASIAAAEPTVTVVSENTSYDQDAAAEIVFLDVLPTGRRRVEVGPGARFRYSGLLQATVSVPRETGAGRSGEIQDAFVSAVDGNNPLVVSGGPTVRFSRMDGAGLGVVGQHYHRALSAPFEFDE